MAPKKRTSSGTVKHAVVELKTIKEGQVVSVSGKVMSKTGLMTKAQTGTTWAWADIQDSEDGGKMRIKGFKELAKRIAELKFLGTFDFHQFRVDRGFSVPWEASPGKGSSVDENPTNLNPDATWDQKEYGPLTDTNPGEDKNLQLNFLLKVVERSEVVDEWFTVEVVDEEGTKKTIKVHQTHERLVIKDGFLVVHRAKMLDDICVVEPWSMLATAPEGYTF